MNVSVGELSVPARRVPPEIDSELIPWIARQLHVRERDVLSYRIVRRSIDARKKPDVRILYRLTVSLREGAVPENSVPAGPSSPEIWNPPDSGAGNLPSPLIVGAGPAGLFAALVLALAGCRPVVLERGRDVERRKADIDRFFQTRTPNPESNLLFGEGGAGTWSDGKLFTRIRDPRAAFVLRAFADAGAPQEILYFQHPHIGSDRLPGVVAALRERIRSLGGTFLWDSRAVSLRIRNGHCTGVKLSDGSEISAPAVLVACGHSARTLIRSMTRQGVSFAMKGFQTGVRIEHLREWIDRARYGAPVPVPSLGAAEYALADSSGSPGGLVSFCMCPGGEILPAVSEPECLRTNGMSCYARSGPYSNAALVTTFPPDSFSSPGDAFDFLAALERKCFRAGGSDYTCPAQNAEDFLAGTLSKTFAGTSYRLGLVPARLDELLPDPLVRALRGSLAKFDRTIPGFLRHGVLTGIETGVSSPVRFLRDPLDSASSLPGLWIAGEGAGCAGGITSAAVDGIRMAEFMLRRGNFKSHAELI